MITPEFLMVTSAVATDRNAIIFEGKNFTYGNVQERSNRLANTLQEMGVQKGDRVALIEVNCNHCVETYFACAKLGAIYVPLNFRAKADELEFMIQDSGASVVFVGERYVPLLDGVKKNLKAVKHYVTLSGHKPGLLEYEKLVAKGSPDDVFSDSTDDDMTILLFTAGTTGKPKGVMLLHKNFSEYVTNNVTPVDPDVEEKNILTVPLYHIAGIQAVMSAIYGGRTLVIQRQFDPEDWMKLVQTYKVDRAMM
ncbi:MAG: AMP-binding protein, partial [Chloroflexi bacterium]|nr:AMP-binding protein [Chloroflexota bacterium]